MLSPPLKGSWRKEVRERIEFVVSLPNSRHTLREFAGGRGPAPYLVDGLGFQQDFRVGTGGLLGRGPVVIPDWELLGGGWHEVEGPALASHVPAAASDPDVLGLDLAGDLHFVELWTMSSLSSRPVTGMVLSRCVVESQRVFFPRDLGATLIVVRPVHVKCRFGCVGVAGN